MIPSTSESRQPPLLSSTPSTPRTSTSLTSSSTATLIVDLTDDNQNDECSKEKKDFICCISQVNYCLLLSFYDLLLAFK